MNKKWIYKEKYVRAALIVEAIENRLRWFGHIMRRNDSEAVRIVMMETNVKGIK